MSAHEKDAQRLLEDLTRECEAQRVQLQLVRSAVEQALETGTAFGSELRLALRIKAILEHKL